MTALFAGIVTGRSEQLDYLTGELRICRHHLWMYYQLNTENPGHSTLDDFESNPQFTQNTLGGTVSSANFDEPGRYYNY